MGKLSSSCGVLAPCLGPPCADTAPLDEATVEAMCLSFSLPGEDSVALVTPGAPADDTVRLGDLGAYVQGVLEVTLRSGVRWQVGALREGLHDVVPAGALGLFTEEELASMIGGVGSALGNDPQEILEAIACDHGYTRGASRGPGWLLCVSCGCGGRPPRWLPHTCKDDSTKLILRGCGAACREPSGALAGGDPGGDDAGGAEELPHVLHGQPLPAAGG
jgi:hypothetical protein